MQSTHAFYDLFFFTFQLQFHLPPLLPVPHITSPLLPLMHSSTVTIQSIGLQWMTTKCEISNYTPHRCMKAGQGNPVWGKGPQNWQKSKRQLLLLLGVSQEDQFCGLEAFEKWPNDFLRFLQYMLLCLHFCSD